MSSEAVSFLAEQHLRKRSECPLCKSGRLHPSVFFDGFEISKCLDCNFRFQSTFLDDPWMDRINNTPDLMNLYFPECAHYFELQNPDRYIQNMRTRWEDWLSYMEARTSGRRLLDIGCGTGEFLSYANSRGWEGEGVDYNPKLVHLAQTNHGLSVQVAEFGQWDKPVASYHLITLFDILEHFLNPVRILELCYAMLAPAGRLIIAVPNDQSLLSLLARWFFFVSAGRIQRPARLMYEFDHRSFCSPESLRRLLNRTSFEVERIFQDETNLERVDLGPWTKWAVGCSFIVARLLGLRNRLVVFARKGDAS